ncbi:hypothetical protein Nepgr_014741 [Nepenthes gracilis]|uniref:Transmembrane protein n=1 Tax=Nepenthes gracilis TaxID=150966 RepID=A0AAD3XQS7_NEPGR|nr:hypothetical protein Nepgr_014741 [Nepenthes gracilis]
MLKSGDADFRPPDGYSSWGLCFLFDLQRCSGRLFYPAVLAANAVVLQHLRVLFFFSFFWFFSWALTGGCCCWLHLYDYGSAAKIDLLNGVLWNEAAGAELLFNSWVLALSGGGSVSWASSSGAVWMTANGLWLGWCKLVYDANLVLCMMKFWLVIIWLIIHTSAAHDLAVLPPLVAALCLQQLIVDCMSRLELGWPWWAAGWSIRAAVILANSRPWSCPQLARGYDSPFSAAVWLSFVLCAMFAAIIADASCLLSHDNMVRCLLSLLNLELSPCWIYGVQLLMAESEVLRSNMLKIGTVDRIKLFLIEAD